MREGWVMMIKGWRKRRGWCWVEERWREGWWRCRIGGGGGWVERMMMDRRGV